MYQVSLSLHNVLRWVILILLVVAIVRAIGGISGSKPFTRGDKRTGLFLMISAHIMFLIGIYQWLLGAWGLQLIRTNGMGEVMKNSVYRYWSIEHITSMLIAIVLITIGRGVGKKKISDRAKHRKTFWYFLIALVVLLAMIPWPFRTGIGRPLLPTSASQVQSARSL